MRNLESITVKGFKSIKTIEDFKLNNLNILIGANGSGKSNFIELFRIISAMMKRGGLQEVVAGTADAFCFGGPKQTPDIHVKLNFGTTGYEFKLSPTDDGFLLISDEKTHAYLPDKATHAFSKASFDSNLIDDLDSETSADLYQTISSWQFYHVHDTGKLAGMRRFCDIAHAEKLQEDAGNIAAFLWHLKDDFPRDYEQIRHAIQVVVPFFDDFMLQPTPNKTIRLNWRQKDLNDVPMRPSQLSDGTLRFICLATALLQPDLPSTIIMDEPELGLHPEAIGILAELIKAAATRTQLIIATQSSLLLDQFAVEDIIVTRRNHGASTFQRLRQEDLNHWLDDHTLGELWTKNVIEAGTVHE